MKEFGEKETIVLTIDDLGVCTLTLNRPQVHNAFNEMMIEEITEALEHLERNKAVRTLLLRGAGKSFSAGADLKWMRRMADYDESQNFQDAQRMSVMMDRLYRFPRPTVAVIQGSVFGGGVGLVACCDIAIASQSAIFSLSEVKLGLIPAVISPYVVEAIGIHQARRYFLTGERFSASVAHQIGLIHECYNHDHVSNAEQNILNEILQSAPGAQSSAKKLLQSSFSSAISPEIQEETARLIAQVRASDEGKEGTTAFIDKRPPSWRQ